MEQTTSTPKEQIAKHNSAVEDLSSTTVSINALGYAQELDRNFGLLSICAVGIVTGNAWAALGGTFVGSLIDNLTEWNDLTRRRRWRFSTVDQHS